MMILDEGTSSEEALLLLPARSSPRTHLGALHCAPTPRGVQVTTADGPAQPQRPRRTEPARSQVPVVRHERGLQELYLSHEAIQRDLHVRF